MNIVNPKCFEIYHQEIDELAALGRISKEQYEIRLQEIHEGLENYYASLDKREPYE